MRIIGWIVALSLLFLIPACKKDEAAPPPATGTDIKAAGEKAAGDAKAGAAGATDAAKKAAEAPK